MATDAAYARFLAAFAVILTVEDTRRAFLDSENVSDDVFQQHGIDPLFVTAERLKILRDNRTAVDAIQAIWKDFANYENPPCPSPVLAASLQGWATTT